MPASDELVRGALTAAGYGVGVQVAARLAGGVVADAWLIRYADGSQVVAKSLAGAPGDLFAAEAEGLAALAATGQVRTPAVLAATSDLLVLEVLGPLADHPAYWTRCARDLAGLHRSTRQDQFGWPRDGYLGRLPQRNDWASDGHVFFAEQRLLRYLGEPLAGQALTAADRQALERLCDRLPDIIPAMPPVLTHGDLWSGNLLSAPGARPAFIDPAVSYTWAEVDLSMLWCGRRPPGSDRFFDAYQEINPTPPGWEERFPVLFLRELLSALAHDGATPGVIAGVHQILAPFRSRPPAAGRGSSGDPHAGLPDQPAPAR